MQMILPGGAGQLGNDAAAYEFVGRLASTQELAGKIHVEYVIPILQAHSANAESRCKPALLTRMSILPHCEIISLNIACT